MKINDAKKFHRTPLEQAAINLNKSLKDKTKLAPETQKDIVTEFAQMEDLTFLNTDMLAVTCWFLENVDPDHKGKKLVKGYFADKYIQEYVDAVPTNTKKGSPKKEKLVKLDFSEKNGESRELITKIKANIYRYAKLIYKFRYNKDI